MFYLRNIPVSPLVPLVAITSFEISTGIVVLAPESIPSIVIVVVNLVLDPNNEVLLIAVRLNDVPFIVSLKAESLNGLRADTLPFCPTPTNACNNLL